MADHQSLQVQHSAAYGMRRLPYIFDYALKQAEDRYDEEQQQQIFDQFYRVSDPSEKTYPGLGLGLYIASEIVKRHGGTLHVQSAKDDGATFTIILPLTQENGADGASS